MTMEIEYYRHQYGIPPVRSGLACVEVLPDGTKKNIKRRQVKEMVFQAALANCVFVAEEMELGVHRLFILSSEHVALLQLQLARDDYVPSVAEIAVSVGTNGG